MLTSEDQLVLRGAVATVGVPAVSDIPLEDLLGQPEIEQRETLYYDERLKILVYLEFPTCSEEQLQSYLSNLDLKVEVWASAFQHGGDRSPIDSGGMKDMVASAHVPTAEDPFTLVKQGDKDDMRLQLVWEAYITLNRPRLRSLEQSVVFLAIATILYGDGKNSKDSKQTQYLKPFEIPEANAFGQYRTAAASHSTELEPYMPISRLEKVIPAPPKRDTHFRLRYVPSDSIRAYTVAMPRLKYNRINTSSPTPVTIASLDIEVIPFVQVNGTIETIDITMGNGKVTNLMPDFLPMACKSKDCMTFLYSLQSAFQSGTSTPAATDAISQSPLTPNPNTNLNIDVLSISINITLTLTPTTKATIQMSWTTNVDFSQALNPAFGAPAQPLQRTNRPTSLNFTPNPDSTKSTTTTTTAPTRDRASSVRAASTSLHHQIIPQSLPRPAPTSILSISFLAPTHPIPLGKPFIWRALIVNNSPRPVKLAIVPLPRIQRPSNPTQHFQKRHAPKASNASTAASTTAAALFHTQNKNQPTTARAIVDDHVLYALHHQTAAAGAGAVPVETDLVSLTAELRVGPLGVGQCHEAEIRFVAYKTGVFHVDAIRVVDLDVAREHSAADGGVAGINDVRELPEIVVVDRGGEEGDDGDGEGGSEIGEDEFS